MLVHFLAHRRVCATCTAESIYIIREWTDVHYKKALYLPEEKVNDVVEDDAAAVKRHEAVDQLSVHALHGQCRVSTIIKGEKTS